MKVLTVILTVSQERCISLINQFKQIGYPFPIETYFGYTPETSKHYIQDKDNTYPELNTTICCFRSHIGLLYDYQQKDFDYLFVLEDDASIHSNLTDVLIKDIQLFETYKELDFLYVGYNLYLDIEYLEKNYKRNGRMFEGIWCYNLIWGCMGTVYKKQALQKLSVLHQPTSKDARRVAKEFVENRVKEGKPYCNKYIRLQSDALIPLFCKYGLVYPPLVIEKPGFQSNIEKSRINNQMEQFKEKHPKIDFEKFL
jgi:GR25 family glycosyltransferase involved in LPS biosynthesis